MLIWIEALMPWVDSRDSKKRTHARDDWSLGFRDFLINPNRISDMKVFGTGSQFLFADNHRDRRENSSFIRCNQTVAEVEAAHNLPYASNFVTLPFCPKNDPSRNPINVTLDVEDIAYFDRYNDDPDNFVWLIYCRKAWRRVEQLVALNLEQAEDVVETGTTTTTSTTTSDLGRTTEQV